MNKNWQLPFSTIWIGQALSLIGSSIARFALIWWLTMSTGSATVLATATLVAILPRVLLAPVAAALVDRWNRRVVMMVADAFIALASAWLAYLFWTGAMQVWHVYVIMLVRSTGGGFHSPAMVVSTSLMVPRRQLTRVAGLDQARNGVLSIVTPPVSALLLRVLPLHGIMGIDVLTAAFAIAPLFFVRIPQPRRVPPDQQKQEKLGMGLVLADVGAGLRYVWHWSGLFALFVISGLVTLTIRPSFSLIPILVTSHFGGQALELAWVESAFGIGVVAGGIILSFWGGFRRRVVTILAGVIGIGAGLFLLSISPATTFWLALVLIFITGFMFPIIDGPLLALIQSIVEPRMQGRVFSLMVSMSEALSPLSMAIAGPVSDTFGVRTWYILGGLSCMSIGVAGFAMPTVVRLEDRKRE